ncbi:hypothetical protein C8R46DRAFT_62381 [Mycena filopes]|nr:hypothetical protein C8R46DRAFT_62381 [Mycena filopes]
MRRDPWLGVTVAILMLLYFRYRYAIVLRETIIPGSVQFLINVRKISRETSAIIPNLVS